MALLRSQAAFLTAARRDLQALRSAWPLLLPDSVAVRARQALTAALHARTLQESGRAPGDALQNALATSQTLLVAALQPGASDRPDPFRDYAIELILDDDSHPYLIRAAAAGPDGTAPFLSERIAHDLRSLQAVVHAVDAAVLAGVCAGQDRRRRSASGGDAGDPLALAEPSWSVAGPRQELRDAFEKSDDWGCLKVRLAEHVHRFGLGQHQGCAAYRLDVLGGEALLQPVRGFAAFDLSWLAGNAERIGVLEDNTRNLLDGFRSHNALIWGPRGCGKSSLIQGLITRYWDRGLRGIEIPSTGYAGLRQLNGLVRDRREYFIAVLDNIGLDRTDAAARLLSSVLDGGLEETPRNLVFYATSNYKDLVDRDGERPQGAGPLQADSAPAQRRTMTPVGSAYDPQAFQRLDERRALDDRFALKVFVDLPTKTQYEQLVLEYARRAGVDDDEEQLLAAFQIWRMRHNHDLVGGRTARDFILARYPDHARSANLAH